MTRPGRIEHHKSIEYVAAETTLPPDAVPDVIPDQSRRKIVVSGCCPACGGLTSTDIPYGIPGTGTKGWLSRGTAPPPAAITSATVICECGHAHPGRPADAPDAGCGRFWKIDLTPGLP